MFIDMKYYWKYSFAKMDVSIELQDSFFSNTYLSSLGMLQDSMEMNNLLHKLISFKFVAF